MSSPALKRFRASSAEEPLRTSATREPDSSEVGASFIGMEVAASLAERGMTVTVISPESVPFERTLGKEVGGMYQKVHEGEGIEFQMGRTVHHCEGEAGMATAVVLDTA